MVDRQCNKWRSYGKPGRDEMKASRIVERTASDGHKSFVIQQRHFLFRWWWVDAWINSSVGAYCQDYFGSLEEAKKNLCYFDGTPSIDRVILTKGSGDVKEAT